MESRGEAFGGFGRSPRKNNSRSPYHKKLVVQRRRYARACKGIAAANVTFCREEKQWNE